MSKRGENIYKRKDGRWEGRYIKERSADGKARYAYVYGKSYADAKQKLLDRRIAQAQNIDCSPSHTKYGDILRNWIAMSRVHIKESTYSRYVHLANVHILPYLGELPTDKLTTQTVEKHISFLLNKGRVDKKGGLAPKTVSDILTLIKGSIDYANCSGYSVNCYLNRLTVKKTQLDMRVLSIDEQHRLCDILMRDMNLTKFGVLLCMYTGIRIGEVCALKWESIDFSEGILSIRETLQRIQATDVGACKKTKIVITEPKSKKAIRDIPLPGFVLEYAASLKHNPNVKVIFKLVEKENKDAISTATNMNEADYDLLGRLGVGEALLHYGRVYSPLHIKTYNVHDRAEIRDVIPDTEIASMTTYWDSHQKLLIPHRECVHNGMCKDGCDFKLRSGADFVASRLVNTLLYDVADKTAFVKLLVQLDRPILEVLKDNPTITPSVRLSNCIKIKFLRKALLVKSFGITKAEYEMILKHPNFLKGGSRDA